MPIAFRLSLDLRVNKKHHFNVGFYSDFDSALHRQVALSRHSNKLTDYTGKRRKTKKCGLISTVEFRQNKVKMVHRTDYLLPIDFKTTTPCIAAVF